MIFDIIIGVIGIAACVCMCIPAIEDCIADWEISFIENLRGGKK